MVWKSGEHVTVDEMVDELVCLNRQVVYREACRHTPRHESVGDAIVRRYAADSPPDVQKRIRAASSPRR